MAAPKSGGYVYAAPLLKPPEFDAGRFGRWLRMMLVSFYSDEEAVLADLLYRKAAMLKDTVLARTLHLPERQVRQLLEGRLVPDCLLEKQVEGTGDKMHTFYRISPIAVAVAAKRLQRLEDSLASKMEEKYLCPKCQRAYDSLQAMSASFACGDCGEALTSGAGEADAREDRLRRFRTQCRDLLMLTQELEKLPGPQFGRQQKEKSKTPKEKADVAKPSAGLAAPSAPLRALPPMAESQAAQDPRAERWFQREVLGDAAAVAKGQHVAAPRNGKDAATPSEDAKAALQEAVKSVQSSKTKLLEERLKSQPPGKDSEAEAQQDSTVLVRGVPYALREVLADEDLQEDMTDEEYQRFYDLDRALQRQKMRR